MIPKREYFRIEEFLPRDFYDKYKGKGERLWLIFDDRALWTIEALRKRYGKIILNDWLWRKNDPRANHYRGFRTFDCKVGASLSQHKFGRALDSFPLEAGVEKIRKDIIDNPDEDEFKFITCIEMDVSWLHFDVRNWDRNKYGILKIKP